MLYAICGQCNICHSIVPRTEDTKPILAYDIGGESPVLLVIDDSPDVGEAASIMSELMGKPVPFTYTSSVRCLDRLGTINNDALVSRCSVWTHSLVEGRAAIITTRNGLKQLKAAEDRNEGDLFKHSRLGVVLVIPPLNSLDMERNLHIYTKKVKRVLSEVGL